MIRRRPGSVVAPARSRSTPSAHAVRRGGAAGGAAAAGGIPWGAPGPACGTGGPACGGTAGVVGAPRPGGAALPFGGCVT
ncbi:hypothetical protein [Streptomyces sp. NPDC127574]|uniref:hypothetical protein n=1 Tax=Streptomyces sp. NPDC127574 TaxID=3345401 RepID=UPI003624D382